MRVVPQMGRHKECKHKYGKIHSISKFNIVIDYKKYKESFNISDLVTSPNCYKLKVWTGIAWAEINYKHDTRRI
jgi:hypothetical protein